MPEAGGWYTHEVDGRGCPWSIGSEEYGIHVHHAKRVLREFGRQGGNVLIGAVIFEVSLLWIV